MTIDFGDGRVLHRTITGNSIHYLLDATGRPLDALPGLYAPKAFLAQLREMVWLHDRWTHSPASDRERRLLMYHALRARSASETAERYDSPETAAAARRARLQHPAYAWEATRLTFSKESGEEPMFKSISFGTNSIVRKAQTVAERFDPDEQFSAIDENALSLIREKRAPLHESPAALACHRIISPDACPRYPAERVRAAASDPPSLRRQAGGRLGRTERIRLQRGFQNTQRRSLARSSIR
ncbi:MAG TPA: hypothetical protein VGQ21_19940 [Thermoanaerobaculia bacterium]|nr:hypothetical protein [Thermoanaerobaculia bacterium]